ncbi:cyclase family protein [Geodermatophilus sp. DSM 44513]|uniref:cyclase family protein n=1 Tax=Geodermatophilus sp. DSM 44513 TaxID=1528104 RepID=UPI0012796D37|nr:cyclase family protein [Geodermatophilus sp. DSM 44513]WNV76182.1 cyclase family protein [Geodermatophilus sp. DSM 44513]
MTTSETSTTDALLAAVGNGVRIVELGHPFFTGMPCSPNHPGFRMSLIRRHGDLVRPDGGSAANEIIVTGGHVGTHVDALSHVSHDGVLHGGVDAAASQTGGRFQQLGAEHTPALLTRGVLLDVAATRGVEVLPAGYGVTARDLADAADAAGVQVRRGDVALIRTGWARHFADPTTYLGQSDGVPGAAPDAGQWLADAGVVAAGADTTAFEQIRPGAGHSVLPVHGILLVEAGIHILEHLDLEAASAQGLTEFVFVMAPLRIVGGTGSPIRPFAAVPA